jgi:hypothetical protein
MNDTLATAQRNESWRKSESNRLADFIAGSFWIYVVSVLQDANASCGGFGFLAMARI